MFRHNEKPFHAYQGTGTASHLTPEEKGYIYMQHNIIINNNQELKSGLEGGLDLFYSTPEAWTCVELLDAIQEATTDRTDYLGNPIPSEWLVGWISGLLAISKENL